MLTTVVSAAVGAIASQAYQQFTERSRAEREDERRRQDAERDRAQRQQMNQLQQLFAAARRPPFAQPAVPYAPALPSAPPAYPQPVAYPVAPHGSYPPALAAMQAMQAPQALPPAPRYAHASLSYEDPED